jgi:RNA polymerase sigma-70 factor (ECF subfamily)
MINISFFLLASLFSRRLRNETEILYSRYYAILRRRCLRLLRDEAAADDVLQEIFWTVARRIDQYQGDHAQILPWLYRITTTHCFKWIERDKRWLRNLSLALEEGSSCEITEESDPVDRLAMEALLLHLPPSIREIVVYRYVDEMTQEEIAEVMGLSRDQIRTGIKRFQERAARWREESHG